MQNYLAQLGAWVTVVQGVIFVICVLAFRRGIVGEIGRWMKRSLVADAQTTTGDSRRPSEVRLRRVLLLASAGAMAP